MELTCEACNKLYFYIKRKNTKQCCNSCLANLRRFHKKQMLVEYKGKKCIVCQYSNCIEALTFHHLDPSKKEFTLSGSHTLKWPRLLAEVDKCVLLCTRCHMEVHAGYIKLSDILNNSTIIDFPVNTKKYFVRDNDRFKKLDSVSFNVSKEFLEETLKKKGSVKETANALNASIQTIYDRCKEWNIKIPTYVPKQKINLTRDELVILVWQKSMSSIAKDFNVSVNAIKKRVNKWGITSPGVGFWAKVNAGLIPHPNGKISENSS